MSTPTRASGWQWPAGIVLVLGATVAGNFWVMKVAGADPAFAIEKDYYRRAVAWDAHQAQQAANAQLGWRATGSATTATGGTEVRLDLTDTTGAPVPGAAVAVVARQHAHASSELVLRLEEQPDHSYRAVAPLAYAGVWHLDVTADRAGARFTARVRVEAPAPAAAARPARAGTPGA